MASPFDLLNKLVTKSSLNFDDIIIKTIEKSSNFEQLKNISIQSIIQAEPSIDKDKSIDRLFEQAESQQYNLEPDRLSKYNDYDKIVQKLPTVAAALSTLVDNTITPDNNFTNIFKYEIEGFVEITPDIKTVVQTCKNIVKAKELESVIESAAHDLAKYGCYFIEVEETKSSLYKYKVLQDSEDKIIQKRIGTSKYYFEKTYSVDENMNLIDKSDEIEELSESIITSDGRILLEDDKNGKVPEDLNLSLEEINVKVISPKNVLVVHSFDTIIGYLVIIPQPGNVPPNEQLAKNILQKLFQDSNIPALKKLLSNNPQYESFVASLLNSYNQGISDIKTRFVPVDNMIHDFIGNNFPYGESRLEPIREIAKYLIIGNNATMLYRFTRAPDIRIFKVDIGLDHDSARYIQQIKNELQQRKYAVDMNSDVDALVKQLTQFEDLWVPMRQGQQFFEIEVQPSGDLQSKIEDLKFMNDQIISGLDTPPNYLGLERPEDSRYTLAQMNAKYSKTIAKLQRPLNKGIDRLVKLLYVKTIGPNVQLNQISIKLNPPVALILERLAEMYSNVSTIVETVKNLKLPRSYFIKALLPWIDFDSLTDADLAEKIDEILNSSNEGGEGEGDEDLF